MITAGCDLGSTTAKAVIIENDIILAHAVIPARLDPRDSARTVLDVCCNQANIGFDRISRIVGTGYGQQQIPDVSRCESEITCHARGVFSQVPTARMIIDIGGQDSKVIKINGNGTVVQYSYNDKCAAGTGRFLEIMADALGVSLENMGETGLTCREKLTLSNQCEIGRAHV
jgi:predicted CoA-substrate-specific enzyme activase